MDATKSFIGDEDECLIVDMMAKKYAKPKIHIVSSARIANAKKMEKLVLNAKRDKPKSKSETLVQTEKKKI